MRDFTLALGNCELESWAIAQSDYPWERIKSEYDSKSNISSIDVVFNC